MKLADVMIYTWTSLHHRKSKLWLTVLGIVIGIASVVALLSLGNGFSNEVNRQLSALNGNTIYIVPIAEKSLASGGFSSSSMGPSSGKLTDKDIDRLKKIPEITDISRLSERKATVEYKGKNITATVSGYEPGVFEKIAGMDYAEGRGLQVTDRHVVQFGGSSAEEAFGTDKPVRVNSYVTINGQKYRVISILKKTGGGFGSDYDNGIFVHFEDSYDIFKNMKRGDMDAIAMSFVEGSNLDDLVSRIKTELDSSHKVKPDDRDYSVIDPKFIQNSVGTVLSLVTMFLGAIAAISLVVGGLAIASSMFTSVIERTQEIGVLKAVGADENAILAIFLFEAGALGAMGGIAGTALALAVIYAASLFGLPLSVDFGIAAFGIAFAFAVGMLSGFFPARQAARLSPVEAFRYDS